MKKRVYLDVAAAHPVRVGARRAFMEALASYGNPSSTHAEGRSAKDILEDARTRIARHAGARADTVIFTSGATEANALALHGRIKKLMSEGVAPRDMHLLYQPSAHASIRENATLLASLGVRIEPLALRGGAFDIEGIRAQIRPETALVSVEAVSSATGMRYDTRALRHVLDEERKGEETQILLHVDASQLPLLESFEWTRLGANTMSLDAQKVGGVRGSGVLIGATPALIAPIIGGGSQERGLRPGSEPSALAVAFASALDETKKERESFSKQALMIRSSFLEDIRRLLPEVIVHGGAHVASNIITLSFPGRDTDYLCALLDERGFAVSTKSACEADSPNPSIAVFAETGDAEQASSTLRISFDASLKLKDIQRFSNTLHASMKVLAHE